MFGIIGTFAFFVDYIVVLFLSSYMGISPYISRLISFTIAATTTWILNTIFTFRDSEKRLTIARWFQYMATMLCGALVNYAMFTIVLNIARNRLADSVLFLIAVALGSVAGLVVNYASCRFWLFRKQKT